MQSKIAPEREPHALFLLALAAALELFVCGLFTLLISPDPKNAWLFGFSALRVALVGGIWILATVLLAGGFLARSHKLSLNSAWLLDKGKLLRYSIYGFSFLLIIWGWLALFCPPYLFNRQIYIFERIQPASVTVGVLLTQSWLFFLYARGRLNFRQPIKAAFQKYYRPALIFAVVLAGLEIFIISSKFGLLSNIIFANVPGVPLAGIQFFLILLLTAVWIAFVPPLEDTPFMKALNRYRLIPILIFLAAFLTWGLTPMVSHFFSLVPAPPSFQPFPFSDARTYDIGGISILHGYGIYFHQNTDKPLYMLFLGLLHLLAGFDYKLIVWLQLIILAFIPVFLFELGKKFHGAALGICLAFVLIIRQRNAIVLSNNISSVNPKLVMSEEIVLLMLVLLAYLAFRWMRERKIWQALLCGATIGAGSLLRLNPLFLYPAFALLIIPVFRPSGKKFLMRHLVAYSLAFFVLVVPWLLTSVDPQGTPWIFSRIQSVINQRYSGNLVPVQNPAISSPPTVEPPVPSSGEATPTPASNAANLPGGIVPRFLYHLLHNYSTSAMALPDSLLYADLRHLSQRTYWIDNSGWPGDLYPSEAGFIFLNLFLLAVGLGYSWVHYRWAGLIPLTIFFAYSVSLAFAMNSGGRYLVPIDWVFYFYYLLAIVATFQFIRNVLTRTEQKQAAIENQNPTRRISDRAKLGFSSAGILLVAGLLPITNFITPSLVASSENQAEIATARQNISAHEGPGVVIAYGNILYPYYRDGSLLFDLLTPAGTISYSLKGISAQEIALQNGERAFIAVKADANGIRRLHSVYVWQDASPMLVWQDSP